MSDEIKQLVANLSASFYLPEHITAAGIDGFPSYERRILYKGSLACSPCYSRCQLIDDVDCDTPVAVDKCSTNYLEEAVQSISAKQTMYQSLRVGVTIQCPQSDF